MEHDARAFTLTQEGVLYLKERSADPPDPIDGGANIWISDGTGSGSDGDVMIERMVGGTVAQSTLVQNGVVAAAQGVYCQGLSFTEVGTSTTYTGTIEIPAGAFLNNIQIVNTVLWDDTGAVSMIVGDDDDPNGWFEATDMKATALVVGEVFDITNAENWGGEQGAYMVAASGRKGRVTSGVDSGPYYGAASEVIVVITAANGDGSAGRTFVNVTYSIPAMVAATGSV